MEPQTSPDPASDPGFGTRAEADLLAPDSVADPSPQPRSSLWRLLKVLAVIAVASAVLLFIQRNTGNEVRSHALAPEIRVHHLRRRDHTPLGPARPGRRPQLLGKLVRSLSRWKLPCSSKPGSRSARTVSPLSASPTKTLTKAHGNSSNSTECDYANGPDEGLKWARRYDVQGIPATFFIDEDGILVSQHRGMLFSADQLAEQLDQIRPRR